MRAISPNSRVLLETLLLQELIRSENNRASCSLFPQICEHSWKSFSHRRLFERPPLPRPSLLRYGERKKLSHIRKCCQGGYVMKNAIGNVAARAQTPLRN